MNTYNVFAVTQRYMDNPQVDLSRPNNETSGMKIMYSASQDGRLDRLNTAECLIEYGDAFQSSRGNLLVIIGKPQGNRSDGHIQFYKDAKVLVGSSPETYLPQPFGWMCRREVVDAAHTCEDLLIEFRATPDMWIPFSGGVRECYSQPTTEHCKLKFSHLLCWIVVAVNLFKVALMLLVAFGRGESPLLTVGDAVASFLEHADETTKGMCLKTKHDFYVGDWSREPREFDPTRRPKYDAASFNQWLAYLFL